jgi:hypothetical protein
MGRNLNKFHVALLCRRCMVLKSLDEALDTSTADKHPNYHCPDCGGVCDVVEMPHRKTLKNRNEKLRRMA